jgi:hypothetical protein
VEKEISNRKIDNNPYSSGDKYSVSIGNNKKGIALLRILLLR